MKEKALYHLLQLRSTQLQESQSNSVREALDSLKSSLIVESAGGFYTVHWYYLNKSFELNFPHAQFMFYIRGDTGRKRTDRNIRGENWSAALDVWQRVCELCNLEVDWEAATNELAPRFINSNNLGPFKLNWALEPLVTILATCSVGLITLPQGKLAAAIQAAATLIVVPLLNFTATRLSNGHQMQSSVRPTELVLIGLGPALAATLGYNIWCAVPLCLSISLLATFESPQKEYLRYFWLGTAAISVGVLAVSGGISGATTAAVLSLGVVVLWFLARHRASSPHLAVYIGILGVSMLAIVYLGLGDMFISVTPQETDVVFIIIVICSVAATAVASLWWIFGVTFRFMAWFSLVALAFHTLLSAMLGEAFAIATTITAAGFIVATSIRLKGRLSPKPPRH